jgi:tetratricopeptide (TPR) repeat protein
MRKNIRKASNLSKIKILDQQKKYIKSLKHLTKASSFKKNFRDADYFIGKIYLNTKQFKKAKEQFNKILKEYSNDLETLINLIVSKINLREFSDVEFLLKNNKKLFKNDGVYENLYGLLYLYSGENDLSIKYYLESFKQNNNNLNTLINLAYIYLRVSDFYNSKKYFKKALDLNPKNPNTLYNQNLFNNYNEWNGQNLDGKTILILSEQGLGDIIQFSRYIFHIKKKYNVKVIFQTKKKLFHLFKDEDLDLQEGKGKFPFFDYFVFLMSLPKIFYLKDKIFLENYNFIKINNENYKKWKKKFDKFKGKKIGISWQGDKYYIRDSMRSINLQTFEPLFKNTNLNFINLQSGFGIEQIKEFKFSNKLINFQDEIDESENAFEDTISILKNLDLLITVDTALSHLAGTMEIDTWLLQHYNPEWRWQLQSNKFAWYPKHKFFKQKIKDNC